MNRVMLSPDGILSAGGKKLRQSPLPYLGAKLELGQGVSLRSYFAMLTAYSQLIVLNAFFPGYLEKVGKAPSQGCRCDQFDCLEMTKTIELIGYPGDPRLEIYHSLIGRRGSETHSIRDNEIETLLDMQIRLGKIKHVVFGDKVDFFEFDTFFTLFEFLDGIAWELSFQGAPAECRIRR